MSIFPTFTTSSFILQLCSVSLVLVMAPILIAFQLHSRNFLSYYFHDNSSKSIANQWFLILSFFHFSAAFASFVLSVPPSSNDLTINFIVTIIVHAAYSMLWVFMAFSQRGEFVCLQTQNFRFLLFIHGIVMIGETFVFVNIDTISSTANIFTQKNAMACVLFLLSFAYCVQAYSALTFRPSFELWKTRRVNAIGNTPSIVERFFLPMWVVLPWPECIVSLVRCVRGAWWCEDESARVMNILQEQVCIRVSTCSTRVRQTQPEPIAMHNSSSHVSLLSPLHDYIYTPIGLSLSVTPSFGSVNSLSKTTRESEDFQVTIFPPSSYQNTPLFTPPTLASPSYRGFLRAIGKPSTVSTSTEAERLLPHASSVPTF